MTASLAMHQFATTTPVGEQVGPVIFWGILVVLLAVIVWSFVRIRRGSAPAPTAASPRVDQTKPEAWAAQHRPQWSTPPEEFVADAQTWPLGVSALLGIESGQPWDTLAFADVAPARSGLIEAWGIRSRGQLLTTLAHLVREGHRGEFRDEVIYASDPANAAPPAPQSPEEREWAWRFRQARQDARGIRDVDFLAWDLCRVAMLARAGFSLGWLDEAETRDTLTLVARALQDRYEGWARVGDDFRRAQWYWASADGLDARIDDAFAESRQRALLDPALGPWAHLPWQTALDESRVLLADALVAEDLEEQQRLPDTDELGRRFEDAVDAAVARRDR